ncbi:MAG: hypothetical protein KR126chlam6_01489, partial [Candidatus Anoxychlamydiales bacterium]|nr:hypothetical protein [Candidatus Anoxychlamydiales bacterium]
IRPMLSNFVQLPKASIEGHLKGNGICHFHMPKEGEKIKILADIDFEPSNLTIEKLRLYNSGSLNVNFSSESGFLMQGLDFSFYNKDLDLSYLTCKIGQVSYDLNSKNYFLKDTNIYIPQSLKTSFEKLDRFKSICKYIELDDDVDLMCDIQFASDLSRLEIFSNKTCFALKGKKHNLKDLYLDLRDKNCLLSFDYFYKDKFYKIKNDFNFGKEISAKTSFHEEKSQNIKPLQISWIVDENKNLLIKEMIGYFCGTDFMFQEDIDKLNSNKLFGSLKIDNTKLRGILPKNIEDSMKRFSVGSGYEIGGNLSFDFSKPNFINFEGLFSGKDFELLDFQFKTMFAKFKILDNFIQISDFKISDQAGIVTINELLFQKKNNKWQLNMPVLKIKDLRPSLMKPIDKPLDEMTPFLIRELVLKDFKGNLDNKNSFSGNGYFHFINSFKRGHSVFDFPADVLSRIVGIDQELLTPVTGKMDFNVKNAKFNLSKLTDSFSESERSKFFLLGKGQKHYVDFDGNIYLNIAMKQYVLFKFTESFVISIRGNLDDPQFNLKKKRGFLLN